MIDFQSKLIRNFENEVNKKSSEDILLKFYKEIDEYIRTIPCGCEHAKSGEGSFGMKGYVHPALSEVLQMNNFNWRMNVLDEKRRKKVVLNLETLKLTMAKELLFDEENLTEFIKKLYKMARSLKLLAKDVDFLCLFYV